MGSLFTLVCFAWLIGAGRAFAELQVRLGQDFLIAVPSFGSEKAGPGQVEYLDASLEHASFKWYMKTRSDAEGADLEAYADYALQTLLDEAYGGNQEAIHFYFLGLKDVLLNRGEMSLTDFIQDLQTQLQQDFYEINRQALELISVPLKAKVAEIMQEENVNVVAAAGVLLLEELGAARELMIETVSRQIYGSPSFMRRLHRIQAQGYKFHALDSLFKGYWAAKDYNGPDSVASYYVTIIPEGNLFLDIALHQDVVEAPSASSPAGLRDLLDNQARLQLLIIQVLLQGYDRATGQQIVQQHAALIEAHLRRIPTLIEARNQSQSRPRLHDATEVALLLQAVKH